MRDYVGNYRMKAQPHVAASRSRGRMAVQPLRTLFWKTVGTMVVFATCTGVVASFWIGHHIQSSLTSIATLQQSIAQEHTLQVDLAKEREGLLSPNRMMARAAVQHGLYQTSSKQQEPFRD